MSTASWAQSEEEIVEARTKFQQAIELEQAQNYVAALKLFREVGQVKLTPQIRYHIAVCEEHLGQLVAALGGYELALAQSEGMHPDFIAEVEGSIADLNGRIPKLVIARGEGAEAAIVEYDGVELGDAQVGVEMPINPGPHTVVARAPGFKRFHETIAVQEGSTKTLTITLEALPPPPADAIGAASSGPQGFGILPFVVGGAGAGAAILGGVFMGLSAGKVSSLKKECGGTDCTGLTGQQRVDGEQKWKSARTLETVGWVGVGVGAAALAAGTTLFLIDRKRLRPEEEQAFRVVPTAPRADAGVSLITSF